MNLVFIYGPPAAGKLSVATELAIRTDYTLFHNHQSIEFVKPIFPRGTPLFERMIETIRLLVIEEAARADLLGMIFTFVYAHPEDAPFVERVVDAVERHGGLVYFVQLVCDPATLGTHVANESRTAHGKITSPDTLHDVLHQRDLFTPLPGRHSLQIDSKQTTPHEAAQHIAAHYALL
jgi:chloramphenicol 3-O-phosphotransferase